jgi:molybdopterin converting factor small subunit
MIRVVLPVHLQRLAGVGREVQLEVTGVATLRTVVDALEARYPNLRGAVRDRTTLERRPLVRYYACREDYSNEPLDTRLPDAVVEGREPFLVVGSIAGG